jgi:hypothetical protein
VTCLSNLLSSYTARQQSLKDPPFNLVAVISTGRKDSFVTGRFAYLFRTIRRSFVQQEHPNSILDDHG